MNRGLLWRLVIGLVVGAVMVFSVLHHLAAEMRTMLSKLDQTDQQQLHAFAQQLEDLTTTDTESAISVFRQIAQQHQVWSAVIDADNQIFSYQPVPDHLKKFLGFQRKITWPVHDFMENTLIGIPISNGNASFVIELPRSMYPKVNAYYIQLVLTVMLPILFLLVFCLLLYRYMMRPLYSLKDTASKLANRDLDARVLPSVLQQNDEFADVGKSFNVMAQQLQQLVTSQQQMLGNLSHEMRTPITRLELALDLAREQELSKDELIVRLAKDVEVMNHLVEDSLNLAWLESNPVIAHDESFSLAVLLNSICEDAAFEFPQHNIICDYQGECWIEQSNQKVLSHSIENVLRNALHYSPQQSEILVSCQATNGAQYIIAIKDQGYGVNEAELEQIFTPFYRADKDRANRKGFGLGLAIARRQLEAIGASISAQNQKQGGLRVDIKL